MPTETDLSSSLEDYLESIYFTIREKQVARAKDIIKHLGVTGSSVTGALRALSEKGLVNYAPYDVITLTPKGTKLAKEVARRHEALRSFFMKVLLVERAEAEDAACKMEHSLSRSILDRIIRFVDFTENCPFGGTKWIEGVGYQCMHGDDRDQCANCMLETLEKTAKANARKSG